MCLMGWLPLQQQLHLCRDFLQQNNLLLCGSKNMAAKKTRKVKYERSLKMKRQVKRGGECSRQADVDVGNGLETDQLFHADALLA